MELNLLTDPAFPCKLRPVDPNSPTLFFTSFRSLRPILDETFGHSRLPLDYVVSAKVYKFPDSSKRNTCQDFSRLDLDLESRVWRWDVQTPDEFPLQIARNVRR
jgi:hypothetical protein